MSCSAVVDMVVINPTEEKASLIAMVLQEAGWTTTCGDSWEFKQHPAELAAFLTRHDPRVVIWNIGWPYRENWFEFKAVQDLPCARDRQFVLTSTDRPWLTGISESTATATSAEAAANIPLILGDPFGMDDLMDVVRVAWAAA